MQRKRARDAAGGEMAAEKPRRRAKGEKPSNLRCVRRRRDVIRARAAKAKRAESSRAAAGRAVDGDGWEPPCRRGGRKHIGSSAAAVGGVGSPPHPAGPSLRTKLVSDVTIAPFPRRAPPVKSFVSVLNKSLVQVICSGTLRSPLGNSCLPYYHTPQSVTITLWSVFPDLLR